ncbi:MAG TPA: right-handed parallel beta-helix repeat-containing protein, partial [Planctomycetes bacterium]|nr:right-handed parallel beta-helix repeat-containing protein [Planctomycetota bacterium]
NRVSSGFRAGPGRVALRNVSVVRCAGPGVVLTGQAAVENRVEGDFSFLRVLGNTGAGVVVRGLTGLRFQESLIRRNGNEGVLARELEVNPEGELLFSLEGCRIEANRAGGVEIGLSRGPAGSPGSGPGRSLARLRRCLVRDNVQEGVRAVAELGSDPPVEGTVQILFSSFIDNGGSGVLVQSSPQAMILVSGNRVSANRGVAGITVGSGTGGIVRVSNNAVFGNTHDGIRVNASFDPRLVMVHNNDSAANGGTGLLVEGKDTAALSNTVVWNKRDVQAPWLAYSLRGSGTGGPGVFGGNPGYRVFPVGIQFLDGPGSEDLVHVPWPGVTAPGEFVEIADDGVPRAVEEVTRTGIRFSPPLERPAPVGAALYVALSKEGVEEDLRVGTSSPVRGRGSPYLRDPRGGKATVGFLGGPLAVNQVGPGGAGPETDLSFQDLQFLPPPGTHAYVVDRITVIAGRELDEATVNSTTVRLFNASKMAALPARVNVFGKGKDRFVVAG